MKVPFVRQRVQPLLIVAGLLATASLVIEYGTHVSSRMALVLNAVEVLIAAFFGVELLLGFVRARDRRALARQRWFELLLIVLLIASLGGLGWLVGEEGIEGALRFFHVHSLPKLYLVLIQIYVLGGALAGMARAHELLLERQLRPETLLLGGFLALILLGTGLLSLPRVATAERLSLLDALFTSTSAVCVTGLSVRDAGTELTRMGQGVLLALFQVGGLGIVTFVSFGSILSGRRLSVPHLVKVRTLVSAHTMADVRRQVFVLVVSAFVVEGVGASLLWVSLPPEAELHGGRIWWSVFHSVSAFCNAGFGLESDSLVELRGATGVNLTIMALLIVGGLGAPVVSELVRVSSARLRRLFQRRGWRRTHVPPIQVQARLALVPTLVLLPFGMIGFYLLEHGGALSGLGLGDAWLASAFQSATARTAGFSTLDFGSFSDATLLFLTGFMVIGASPVSTGGGIKTATVMVLFLTLRAAARGREEVEYGGRTIARTVTRAALSVLLLYIVAAAAGVLVLSLTDPQIGLRDRVFEVVSALSTVGLSTGVTESLSNQGKLLLCVLMFAGRVGPMTLMLDVFRPPVAGTNYRYPTETVVLG